jgi:hypothetical protein
MRRCAIAAALALAALAAGCGDSGSTTTSGRNAALDQSAGRFVVGIQAQLRRGRFAQAWHSLHPAEQRAVSASRLASCYPRTYYPRTVTFRASEVRDVSWQVPGTTGLSDAEAVTVTARSGGKTIDTFDQHIVRRGNAWRWILSADFFAKAKRGC